MTGDEAYITARSQSLVLTFSSLLGKGLELRKSMRGQTDCKTFIESPLHHPEGYLVTEHEVSHNLFGTDCALADDACKKIVERLFTRAKAPIDSPELQPWRHQLFDLVHTLWNILEDQRCCGLWGELYPAGGSFLFQRWHDISEYEHGEVAKTSLCAFVGATISQVPVPGANPKFLRCVPDIVRASNLVVGVNAPACIAITARLVDDLAECLLDTKPKDKQEEAKSKMQELVKAHQPQNLDPTDLGGSDVLSTNEPLKAAQKNQVIRLLTAKDDDMTESGMSSFEELITTAAIEMGEKLDQARMALSMPKKSDAQKEKEVLQNACVVAGIEGHRVWSVGRLPSASAAAGRTKAHLDAIRMKVRKVPCDDGDDADIERMIAAKLGQELGDADIFDRRKVEGGLELLLLVDLSGSMSGHGVDMVDQAIADIHFGCGHDRTKVLLWGFSNEMFFFDKPGSVKGANGVHMAGTDMVQALDVALEWARVSVNKRAVLLVTDGFPTSLRERNTTGDVIQDFAAVLNEMRGEGIVLSVLAVGTAAYAAMYDQAFGRGQYGLVNSITEMARALPEAAKVMVEAHMFRTTR